MEKSRTYFCIDMKSFFASVECAERGMSSLDTNLVVADKERGSGALCLAVSPKMKALGVKNRCRLFEIPESIKYITAKPRMKKYIEYAADIYDIYLDYFSPEDIHVYSIDEAFIDATDYLKCYKKGAEELVKEIICKIYSEKRVPATAGIGSNLYLAKVALDITAKNSSSHIGILDEREYIKTLWRHRPITDFWQISKGISGRLARRGIYDMKGIAECSPDILYRIFGINAELLIDHAFGRETCTMRDIKNYRSKSRSVSSSQILFEDYPFDKANTVFSEMVLNTCYELKRRHLIAGGISVGIGYSKDIICSTGGSVSMTVRTNVYSVIKKYADELFLKVADKSHPIRRISVCFNRVADECFEGYDLFTDFGQINKEKAADNAVLEIKDKFGKNAVLRCTDFLDGATAIKRNTLIGGHNGE